MFPHPPTPDNLTRRLPVTTLPRDRARVQRFVLMRVSPDATEEPVSEHPNFTEGWEAGQSAVHRDRDHAYALYRGRTRVAKFGHARSTPRVSVSNLDALVIS